MEKSPLKKAELKKNKYWKILEKNLSDEVKGDIVHGLPHIERVYNNFSLFVGNNKEIPKDILEALECAVVFHDVGRGKKEEKEGKHHAIISAETLKRLFKKELFWVPNQKWIYYSVYNHSKVIIKPESKEEKICADILTLLDHIDALGFEGICRAAIALSKEKPNPPLSSPTLFPPNRTLVKRTINYINNPAEMEKNDDQIRMRDSSILEHIASNYCFTYNKLLPCTKKFLKEEFLELIEKKLYFMKDFILFLLDPFKE